jgi:hypothetical protein
MQRWAHGIYAHPSPLSPEYVLDVAMNIKKSKNARSGMALLAVLFIVMAITLISLGFLSRSDRELACAANVSIRMQMDNLAQSGLNHAKALIINPQDVDTSAVDYWQGQTGLDDSLGLGGDNDYFDIEVDRVISDPDNNHCNYTIVSHAYRLNGTKKISNSVLEGSLRLDPCIALWTGGSYTGLPQTTVHGDVICGDYIDIYNNSYIYGDAFAVDEIWVEDILLGILGDKNEFEPLADMPITAPSIVMSDLYSTYWFEGSSYSAEELTSPLNDYTYGPTMGNPAGIYYCAGDLEINDGVIINGTLLVEDDLTINGRSNTITAEKNFPAMVVGMKTIFQDDGQLTVNGLVQINDRLHIESSCSDDVDFDVTGGVFIIQNAITIDGGASTDLTLTFTAAPELAALLYQKADTTYNRWTPAGGGFFKKISRLESIDVIIIGPF